MGINCELKKCILFYFFDLTQKLITVTILNFHQILVFFMYDTFSKYFFIKIFFSYCKGYREIFRIKKKIKKA